MAYLRQDRRRSRKTQLHRLTERAHTRWWSLVYLLNTRTAHARTQTQTHRHTDTLTRKTHANTHTHRLLDERMEDRHGPRVVPRRLSGHAGEWSPLLGQKRWQLGKNGFVPEQPVRISISMSAGDLQYACICQQPTGSRRWGRACFTLETRSRYTEGWAKWEVERAAHAKQGDRFARDAAWSIRSHSE